MISVGRDDSARRKTDFQHTTTSVARGALSAKHEEVLLGCILDAPVVGSRRAVTVQLNVHTTLRLCTTAWGDVCECRLWRMQRAKRSGSGQNLVSEREQQILGTATDVTFLLL